MVKTAQFSPGGKNQASGALVGAAIIFGVPGLLHWSIFGLNFDAFDLTIIFGCVAMISLAILARWFPKRAATTCLACYLLFLAYQFNNITWAGLGWIIHGS